MRPETSNHELDVDQLLVAVGRAPNVEELGLEMAGVEFNQKGVEVNDRLQTTNPRIFAAGDVCSALQFTHAADFQARIVIQNALFKAAPAPLPSLFLGASTPRRKSPTWGFTKRKPRPEASPWTRSRKNSRK